MTLYSELYAPLLKGQGVDNFWFQIQILCNKINNYSGS